MKTIFIFIFIFILSFSQNLDINSETIKQLVYTEGEAFHHFIGTDPAMGKTPIFEMNALNKIDSLDFSYFIEINTKIYYSDLTIKEHSEEKVEASYSAYIEIIDNKDRTVDQQFKEQLITIEKAYLNAATFKSSKLKFFFAIDPGDYEIRIVFEDKNSNKTYSQKTDFVLRDWKHKNFLISDLEYYDTYSREPIISTSNIINNRKDFILIQFQTYQRNLNNNYTFALDIYEQKKTIEKIGLTLLNLFKSVKSIFVEDTIEKIIEPLYVRTWENIRSDHFMKHADMIEKKIFDEIEFPKNELPPRKLVARVISTLHENQRVDSREFDEIKNRAKLDTINMNKFNFNKEAVVESGQITTATARNEITSEFSFEWEFIPQTKTEIVDAFDKLVYLELDSVDFYKDANLKDAQLFFSRLWNDQSNQLSSKEVIFKHPLFEMKQYFRKLEFCINNFPDINDGNTGSISGLRRRFTNRGWVSDKAKIYMKYGSPDEIHGDNIFNSEGVIIQHRNRPPVQLWVYNKSNKKFYFKENNLITYN